MKHLQLIFIFSISIIGCTSQTERPNDNDQAETNEIKEEKLPVYNIDPETFIPREFGIMDLVNDDLEIIRLETCLECFIAQPSSILVEEEIILVGSNTPGMKPGELLLFSKNGDFRNKIGKGGRGPGEHTGYNPSRVSYYPEDSTVLVVWSGAELQLFDLNGDYKDQDQIVLPHRFLVSSVQRPSDSLWFATGYDDWGSRFGTYTLTDSIRFVLFSQNGEIIKEIRRTNFPPLSRRQKQIFMPYPFPYKYDGTWKFNLYGNDTLFSVVKKNLEPDAILTTSFTEFPLGIKILHEAESYFMLNAAKPIMEGKEDQNIQNMSNQKWELKRYFVLLDKLTGKTYSIDLIDDVFFVLNTYNKYYGNFMESFRWKNDRLTFAISANEWIELVEKIDTSKLRPNIREKLKVLEGLRKDDNPIVFTFTLKDEIDFD